MLECMCLKSGFNFYNFTKMTIEEDVIKNNLEGSLQMYNFLIKIIVIRRY
jgi:hypothetical protein